MSKSVLIIPDAANAVSLECNWYHGYKNRLRSQGHQAHVASSPDEIASSVAEWLDHVGSYREFYRGADAVLVGHGLGALTVIRLLEVQEEPVGTAILVSTPAGVQPIKDSDKIEAFAGGYAFDAEKVKAGATTLIIVHGVEDLDVPVANAHVLAQQFGTLSLVPGAGHFNTRGDVEKPLPYLRTRKASPPELGAR